METTYPAHVHGSLDPSLSRWMWLVKWILAIPHAVVLFFLWIAFAVLSVVAFVAIVFTGRYPRTIFDFNVGVLRWHWRVAYYAWAALGTDRYPPFTLQEVPDYPAHFDVDYPEHLSRGLVWVKWWLLAIPHYLVIGVLLGGGTWAADTASERGGTTGLIPLLVLVAAVVLLFTGRYPQALFDLILGLNRWVLRVAAYAGLMTDRYPPFRLDQGGDADDPIAATGPGDSPAPAGAAATARRPGAAGPPRGWTAGRTVSVVAGGVLAVLALALAVPGVALLAADQVGRDDDGFLTSPRVELSSGAYAITSGDLTLHTDAPPSLTPDALVGDLRVTAIGDGRDVFIGLGPTDRVREYLAGVATSRLTNLEGDGGTYRNSPGGEPPAPPTQAGVWTERASGSGPQQLSWSPRDGDWTVVVMNADGSRGVDVTASAGAEMPALPWLVGVLLGLAAASLLAAGVLITVPLATLDRGAGPQRSPYPPAGPGSPAGPGPT